MREIYPWVKLPSSWIRSDRLREFGRSKERRADEISALKSLLAIAHHSSPVTGISKITYTELEVATSASREKISNGLDILENMGVITREPEGRSTFKLNNLNDAWWCQLPAKRLYNSEGQIAGMDSFSLRQATSLNALKAYLLIAADRDRKSNRAHLTHKMIHAKSGIPDDQIKSALSLLTVTNLILVDQQRSLKDPDRPAFAYRLRHLDTRRHQATVSDDYTPNGSSNEGHDYSIDLDFDEIS